jgi:hypothetical protein
VGIVGSAVEAEELSVGTGGWAGVLSESEEQAAQKKAGTARISKFFNFIVTIIYYLVLSC